MKVYIAIDLKSFYASVECRERGLDPLKPNLVVADSGRTEKTICLAVTPSLKAIHPSQSVILLPHRECHFIWNTAQEYIIFI